MEIYISKKANLKIYLPVNVERAKEITRRVIAILSALALVLGILCLTLSLQMTRINLELGERLSAEDIAGVGAVYDSDFDPAFYEAAGIYRFGIIKANGKREEVRLAIKDTKAPNITVRDINYAIGGALPKPEDFIGTIYEPNDYSGEFVAELPSPRAPGKYHTKVRFSDAAGNRTKVFDVNMNLIYDSIAPTLAVASDIFVYVGEAVAYRRAVTVSDNCVGEIELIVDDSLVNTSEVGEYTVTISALDSVGNKSAAVNLTVHVIEREEVDDELDAKISQAAAHLITENMTAEEKCRAVYEYIQKRIDYTPVSYRTEPRLAAYNALFVTGEGDCYSYFAAAKAFFDYLGIENYEVQRLEGYTSDTHFWNLVNIGEDGKDRWYHFDATVMRREYAINSCLLTDAQLEAYGKLRPSFYEYDRSKYPAVATEIITQNPNLDAFIGR